MLCQNCATQNFYDCNEGSILYDTTACDQLKMDGIAVQLVKLRDTRQPSYKTTYAF